MKQRTKPEAGVSLVEVLIAVAIVSIMAVVISRFILGGIKGAGQSYSISTATQVASGVIEDYKAKFTDEGQLSDYKSSASGSAYTEQPASRTVKGVSYDPEARFTVENGRLRLQVEVSWEESGKSHTVSMGYLFQ